MLVRQKVRSVMAAALIATSSAVADAADDTSIRAIIPHKKVGSEVCFSGTFTDKSVDMKGWPSYAEQANPKFDADGKRASSSRTHDLPGQTISHVALQLTFTNGRRARNESWDFDFIVNVTSPSLGHELYAKSGCTWSGWDYKKQKEVTPEFMLACWIECDGGGMRAVRVPGTQQLDVYFSKLFMQAGCEGGGRYSVAHGEASEAVSFRLQRTSPKACKTLKAWSVAN